MLRMLLAATLLATTAACVSTPVSKKWTSFMHGIMAVEVYGFAVHRRDRERYVVLTPRGVFSRHGQSNWRESSKGIGEDRFTQWGHIVGNSLFQGSASDDQLFAIVAGKLYESLDFGKSWKNLSGSGANSTQVYSYASKTCFDALAGLVQNPSNPNQMFAATINASAEGGLFRSDDGGNTWAAISGDLRPHLPCRSDISLRKPSSNFSINYFIEGRRTHSSYDDKKSKSSANCGPNSGMGNDAWPIAFDFSSSGSFAVAAGPHDGNFGRTDGLKRSKDGGNGWTKLHAGDLCNFAFHSIVFSENAPIDQAKGVWIAASYQQAFSSVDGKRWLPVTGAKGIIHQTLSSSGDIWALTESEVWRWNGAHFDVISDAPAGARAVVVKQYADGSRDIYVTTRGTGVWIKEDGVWRQITSGLKGGGAEATIHHNEGHKTLYASVDGSGLYRRKSSLTQWRLVGEGISANAIDVSISADERVAVWTDGERILRWTSGSGHWEAMGVEPIQARHFGAIRIGSDDRNMLHAVYLDESDNNLYFGKFNFTGNVYRQLKTIKLPTGSMYIVPDLVATDETILIPTYLNVSNALDKRTGLWVSHDGGESFSSVEISELQEKIRGVDPLRVDPDGQFAMFTLWEQNVQKQWKSTLWRFDLETNRASKISTNKKAGGDDDSWLWFFDTDWQSPGDFFASDWLKPRSVLCAEGSDANLNWLTASSLGLPSETYIVGVHSLPWQTDTVVASAQSQGLFARTISRCKY